MREMRIYNLYRDLNFSVNTILHPFTKTSIIFPPPVSIIYLDFDTGTQFGWESWSFVLSVILEGVAVGLLREMKETRWQPCVLGLWWRRALID